MPKLLIEYPDRQSDSLKYIKNQTGLTVSEILRRMADYCLQEPVLNELIPAMSGQLNVQQQQHQKGVRVI